MASRATNQNKEMGTAAEEYVAGRVDGERAPNEWYDVEAPDGTLIEVKSTQETLASGRNGRFRLWREQHDRLVDEGGRYWFLVDGMDPAQLSAQEVSGVIEDRGLSWTGSGNHPKGSDQVKIPWPAVIER